MRSARYLLIAAIAVFAPACRAVEGIFKAGVGVGFFIAIVLVILVVFGIGRLRR
jgi:hypothetical protein